MNDEIYISTDVETDGPIPGPHSMISLGAAAFAPLGYPDKVRSFRDGWKIIGNFKMNFAPLTSSRPDPNTEAWWQTQPKKIYDAARENPELPGIAIKKYLDWVNSFGGKPVFVGYPAGFDFLFVYWYIRAFRFESPFSFSAVDIKTYAMALMKNGYRKSTKKDMPARWLPDLPHTHLAVDDALEQGHLFMNMLQENLRS